MGDELLTLKDFAGLPPGHYPYGGDNFVARARLRLEVIKWIKSYTSHINTVWDVEQWIKHFFNISEDDLK